MSLAGGTREGNRSVTQVEDGPAVIKFLNFGSTVNLRRIPSSSHTYTLVGLGGVSVKFSEHVLVVDYCY